MTPTPKEEREPPDSPLRVLMVEDDPHDAEFIVRELRRGGFSVRAERVDGVEDFRSRLRTAAYDVIITDHGLPGWSGLDVLSGVQESGVDIPVILVTGTLGDAAAVECLQRGAADYVLKDHLVRLPSAVRHALAEKALREEHARAEEALQQSEARLRAVFETEPEWITLLEPDGILLDVNPAGLAMLEADDLAAVRGQSVFPLVAPEHRQPFVELTQRVCRGESGSLEFEIIGLKGARRRVEMRAAPLRMGEKTVLVGITRDVTAQRALERQLRLTHKFDAIGQLAGGIAHDFNNMIGAILGWAELGHDLATGNPKLRNYLHKIMQQSERAATLTRQLLAFARRQILQPEVVNLNRTVQDVTNLLERVIGENIQLEKKLASSLHTVRVDPSQVEQVVMNLCLNARDAMPDGGRLVIETRDAEIGEEYVRFHPFAKTGQYVLLQVTDTGQGMDAATLEHIFEPFFTTKGVNKGTGLGLATVYGIIKQHDGFVHVYSEPGRGTSFHVYFPAVAGIAKPAEKTEVSVGRGSGEVILVAEDHEGLREMARVTLENLGYRPLMASDGEQAIELLRKHRDEVAVLLLDVIMPKLSGPEAYRQAITICPNIPAIFATGYSAESAFLQSLAADRSRTRILPKPYSVKLLGQLLRELLDSSPTS